MYRYNLNDLFVNIQYTPLDATNIDHCEALCQAGSQASSRCDSPGKPPRYYSKSQFLNDIWSNYQSGSLLFHVVACASV